MFRFTRVPQPFYNLDGGGGSGGGAPAGGGAPQGGSPAGGAPSPGGGQTVYELTPDSMIKPHGAKEAIKYSDWQRQHIPQSEYTKQRQRDAQTLTREREAFEQKKQEATRLLLEHAQRIAGGQQQQGAPDLASQIRDKQYIDGQTGAQIVETLQTQGIQPIVQAIEKRDQALKLMFGQMKRMDAIIQKLQGTAQSGALNDRVLKVRDELGLPNDPEANEFLMDIYGSHQGNDLDQQFPEISRKRVEGLRKLFREMDRQAATKARQNLLPGRGGQATPGRQLSMGAKTPQQIAQELGAALGIPE